MYPQHVTELSAADSWLMHRECNCTQLVWGRPQLKQFKWIFCSQQPSDLLLQWRCLHHISFNKFNECTFSFHLLSNNWCHSQKKFLVINVRYIKLCMNKWMNEFQRSCLEWKIIIKLLNNGSDCVQRMFIHSNYDRLRCVIWFVYLYSFHSVNTISLRFNEFCSVLSWHECNKRFYWSCITRLSHIRIKQQRNAL